MQYSFKIKSFNKPGIRKKFPCLIKNIYKKPTVNTMPYGEKQTILRVTSNTGEKYIYIVTYKSHTWASYPIEIYTI